MADVTLLDNPIWNSLNTDHAHLALGDELAKCYPAEIGPLSGTSEQSAEAYESLRVLAGPGGTFAIFLIDPPAPQRGWQLVRGGELSQMIYQSAALPSPAVIPSQATIRLLTTADAPAMVELAKLTEPGPFRACTSRLGTFFGIFESGRLLAMAGQRMHVPGFIEVSAVCTHPNARGRGYARATMIAVMDDILKKGSTPFLHSFADNHSAIRVYQRLGFRLRRTLHLAVLKNEN